MLSSGNNSSRGNAMLSSDMLPLPQCLPLGLITLGNQKYTRSGELRRVLGFPLGSTSEDHSFGVAHSKPPPPVETEEVKNFKESVLDASKKAKDRVKMLRGHILKLDKFRETLSSKKRQRIDLLSNERSGGANLSKMGSQIHRNPHDHATQSLEDRTKTVGLNKRVRTSVADADGRLNAISRQQMVTEKGRDMLRAGTGGSAQIEEKIRRLPAGGEGWDKKIKKKRSVGAVANRVINGDRDMKRAMHHKLSADAKSQSSDAHGFRSRSSPGVSGINKLDGPFEPASSNSYTVLRNELESTPLPRDRTTMLEERVLAKGTKKSNIHEDNPVGTPSTVIKGKVSRAPRTGSVMVLDSSPDVHPSSGALECWEQLSGVNKVPTLGVANNHKRPVSTGSSSHPMAPWASQRPQKISRTRRANLVSPVSNHDEAQISSQGFATSDFSAKISSSGSLLASGVDNDNPKFKMKLENVSSPVGLSESEVSGGGEHKLNEKGADTGEVALNAVHKVGAFLLPTMKNKKLVKEEVGDGVRRQGRSSRGPSLTRPGIPPMRGKLENLPKTKPLQSMRPGSDKNKSKSGRPPSKKLTDRKASTRAGLVLNSGSSDFTGQSDDDHEELLAAANSACNASYVACSSPFWKKMESIFASVSSEDASYLRQQLGFAEELDESLSQMFGIEYNVLGILTHKEDVPVSSDERQGSHSNQESAKTDALSAGFDMGRRLDKVTPLYQRVLSALIEEDESEEFYYDSEGKNVSFQYASDDSHCGSCNLIDVEPKDRDRMEPEVQSKVDLQTQKQCLLDRFSCDKSASANTFSNSSISNSLCNNEQCQGDDGLLHLDVGLVSGSCPNELGGLQSRQINISGVSSFDCQYQLMCLDERLLLELQSIGLYPETMLDLSEGEEVINQHIMELKEGLYQQVGKKKNNLEKIDKTIQNGRDVKRDIEQVAMNQLIEMAYKKRMACRGGNASKSVVRKVSKQVALAFVKRTLARCQKFEDTGRSCFSEPALRDVIFSSTPCNNDAKSVDCVGSGTASNTYNEACNDQAEAMGLATGAVSSTRERHDSHSDNLDRGFSDALQVITHSSEEAFFEHEPILNKGKKREVLLDDVVVGASSRATSAIGSTLLGGVKGKRSDRDRDQNTDILTSNSFLGAGRPSVGSFRSERKTKAKPKQKTNHLSTSGNGLHGRFTEATNPACLSVRGSSQSVANDSHKISREVGLPSPVNIPRDSSKEAEDPIDSAKLQLHELDSIEELGVSNDLGGNQDLSSWFNFDEDGLQDHDSIGLEIPMDDLTELNMLI